MQMYNLIISFIFYNDNVMEKSGTLIYVTWDKHSCNTQKDTQIQNINLRLIQVIFLRGVGMKRTSRCAM